MPYLPTAQSFLEQSTLLLSARPTTARITTKYNIPHSSSPPNLYKPSSLKPKDDVASSGSEKKASVSKAEKEQKRKPATLMLKCYDTASGVCLKYKTDKQAEAGRLMAALGGCGRVMAGLPPKKEEAEKAEPAVDVDAEGKTAEAGDKMGAKDKAPAKDTKAQSQNQGQAQGGGGKKKKKGKR